MTITDIFLNAFTRIWGGFIEVLPNILAAVIVLIVGWLIAVGLSAIIKQIIHFLRLNELIAQAKVTEAFSRVGIHFDLALIIGWLVKWFFIIVFLLTATDILGWTQVTNFLERILFYIPNVIIAVVIMVTGMILANFVYHVIVKSIEAAKLENAQGVGAVGKWSIIIFSFLAALLQLQIAPEIIQIFVTGFVAMLAIAGGIAFGLGGKDEAKRVLEKLHKDLSHKV